MLQYELHRRLHLAHNSTLWPPLLLNYPIVVSCKQYNSIVLLYQRSVRHEHHIREQFHDQYVYAAEFDFLFFLDFKKFFFGELWIRIGIDVTRVDQ